MRNPLKNILMLALLVTALLALAACQAPPQSATETNAAQPPAATSIPQGGDTGYPAVPTAAPLDPGTGYPPPGAVDPGANQGVNPGANTDANPAYPPPSSGVPAAPNLSLVTATLVEQAMDDQLAGHMRLLVTIKTSEAAPGMTSRTDDLIDQQTFLFAEAATMPTLQPGDTFTAEVEYRGDENSGRFFATKITKP